MAKLDKLARQVLEQSAERVVLASGAPIQMQGGGISHSGPVTTLQQLREALVEVIPEHLHHKLLQDVNFHCHYTSLHRPLDLWVISSPSRLEAEISPARSGPPASDEIHHDASHRP
jgi:hypothetical protein